MDILQKTLDTLVPTTLLPTVQCTPWLTPLPGVDVSFLIERTRHGLPGHMLQRDSVVLQHCADTAAALVTRHPDYAYAAGRLAVHLLHQGTKPTLRPIRPFLAADVQDFYDSHAEEIDAALVKNRDFRFDIFGFKTLERSYLLRSEDGTVMERPQALFMRVSLGIHCGDLDKALETYHYLSTGKFTHATPTLFHAGLPNPHLASCFLLPIQEDSIQGIFETNSQCALISKSAGGIGFSVSNVRASGSAISTTHGKSAGLLPMLKCFEATARYVDQGGGKRKGAFAAYLEPWHPDVLTFVDMKKNHGAEELRARDLFYALWIPDLFMQRVSEDAEWSLFCPKECPGLDECWGEEFVKLYESYERQGKARRRLPAQKIWFAILDAQVDTGTPYLLYKDACNAKSNQQHLGTIRCSNLCTEIVQFSSPEETAVCNLGSLALPEFLKRGFENSLAFDHEALACATRILATNLDTVIDRHSYINEQTRRSNLRHRPVGIGVQGLADVFAKLKMPFDGSEARKLNRDIFETIYYASLDASCTRAELLRETYETFPGSPVSRGLLQYDLWGATDTVERVDCGGSGRWDWKELKARIQEHGLHNSLLVAPMPTASTAQILGNNECFEPFTSNLYVRKVLSGEFAVINRHLVRALEEVGLWTEPFRQKLLAAEGSVQGFPELPQQLRDVYKTAWELSMKSLIDLAADRALFVDQSQSLNLFVAEPTHQRLTSMHFYAWKRGLKTGMYYLRTKPAGTACKVTVPVDCVACSA